MQHNGVVVQNKGMAGDPLGPGAIHSETLHLVNHRALTNAALKAEAIFERP